MLLGGHGMPESRKLECIEMQTKGEYMKRGLFGVCASLAATISAAPAIDASKVVVSQPQGTRDIKIEYVLTGVPAVVTVEMQTNTLDNGQGDWISLDGSLVQSVSGDVNKLILPSDDPLSFKWRARRDWPDRLVKSGRFRAVLTAWPKDAPPPYMVCGLESGKEGDVRYYADPAHIPGGLKSDLYKTDQMIFRKVPASGVVWRMGSLDKENQYGREPGVEQPHLVMLSEDYYVAIYETTQRQYELVTGSKPSTVVVGDKFPVTKVALGVLRGMKYVSATDNQYCWPDGGHNVAENSAIWLFRKKTGLAGLDLPTEAQWEYACRAGEEYMFCNYRKNGFDPISVGWYKHDSTNKDGKPREVGTREPNDWNIFDMHGNVAEFCLDRYRTGDGRTANFATDWEDEGVTVDPDGGDAGYEQSGPSVYVVKRGGSVVWELGHARSSASAQSSGGYNYESDYHGFRLVCPAVAE